MQLPLRHRVNRTCLGIALTAVLLGAQDGFDILTSRPTQLLFQKSCRESETLKNAVFIGRKMKKKRERAAIFDPRTFVH